MLEANHRTLLFIRKCFSSHMLQDFYNMNRSWCYTNYGRIRQNSYTGSNDSIRSGYRSQSHRQSLGSQFEFSLMTYNCLSQDLITLHNEMYIDCLPGSLDWNLRRERLARELKDASPDILCLQEVNSGHHNQFYKPFLKSLGYSGLFKKRTGSMLDGCALYYKTSKFTLLDHIELEFYRRDLTSLLNRDNVAIIGVLKPLVPSNDHPLDSSRLVVATTHLLFNPARGDVKLAQMRLLLAELDQLINSFNQIERSKTNVILCGDMNSVPNSPFYNFITTGFLDTSGYLCGDLSGQMDGAGRGKAFRPDDLKLEGINLSSQYITQEPEKSQNKQNKGNEDNWRRNCSHDQEELKKTLLAKYTKKDFLKDEVIEGRICQVRHNFKFSSVYPVSDVNNAPFITTHLVGSSCMVDYIFYTRSDNLELLGYSRLLNSEQMAQIGVLPNNFLGSDHLSLHAKFLIKN